MKSGLHIAEIPLLTNVLMGSGVLQNALIGNAKKSVFI